MGESMALTDKQKEALSLYTKLSKEIAKEKETPYFRGRGLFLSNGRQYSGKFDEADVKDTLANMDIGTMRQISQFFYEASSSYRRILDFYTGIFLYYYHFTISNIPDGVEKSYVESRYNEALTYLDAICAGGTIRDIVTEIMVEGVYYGYVVVFPKTKTAVLTKLDPNYCRNRFKSAYNTDLVEFNTTYFDTLVDADREFVLDRMPVEVRNHYRRFKNGIEESPWALFPVGTACVFYMDSADGNHAPPSFETILDVLNYRDAIEMEKDKDEQQLEKLLVQRFALDEDADLELYLEEIAAMHKATADMFKDNDYIDVLSTIAEEVKMIDSRSNTNNSTATNNTIIKMMLPKYETSGLSSELFYSTTATALTYSIQNATSFIGRVNERIANWLSVFVWKNVSFGEMRPIVEILPVTVYNKDKMVQSYIAAAQNGYSKMVPYIANGSKQSTLLSSMFIENDILDISDKLIPLQTSYTQSSKDSNNDGTTSRGRPQKSIDEKTEETIRTEDQRGEVRE